MSDWLDELDEMEQRQLTGEEYDHYVGLLIDYARELIDAAKKYDKACDYFVAGMAKGSTDRDNLRALLHKCSVYRSGSAEYCDICYEESAGHCSCCKACLGTDYNNVCKSSNCELAAMLGHQND